MPSFFPEGFGLPKAYYATAQSIRDSLISSWNATYDMCESMNTKQAYYSSMEFLQIQHMKRQEKDSQSVEKVKITMATNRCSRSKPSLQSDMEILKILALGISKHGEMDYEAADDLTLNDDNPVTEDALAANFLIPLNEKMGGGGSLAELCCDSLEDFNPMVHVQVEKGDFSSFDVSFFEKIDVVVISCCSLAAKSKAASAFAISEDTYSEPLGRGTGIRLHI
ncbi:SUMO-activating enzyme subunit 1B-1-like protein, partial [Tanacetum coccineum]